jgi:hypothetical protein
MSPADGRLTKSLITTYQEVKNLLGLKPRCDDEIVRVVEKLQPARATFFI